MFILFDHFSRRYIYSLPYIYSGVQSRRVGTAPKSSEHKCTLSFQFYVLHWSYKCHNSNLLYHTVGINVTTHFFWMILIFSTIFSIFHATNEKNVHHTLQCYKTKNLTSILVYFGPLVYQGVQSSNAFHNRHQVHCPFKVSSRVLKELEVHMSKMLYIHPVLPENNNSFIN